MTNSRPNLKLSSDTGTEAKKALYRYREAYQLNSTEETIRHLLPDWAFDDQLNPQVAALIDHMNTDSDDEPPIEEKYETAFCSPEDPTVERAAVSMAARVTHFVQESDVDLPELSVYAIEDGMLESFEQEETDSDEPQDLSEWFDEATTYLADIPTEHPASTAALYEIMVESPGERKLLFTPVGEPASAYTREYVPTRIVTEIV